MTETNGKDELGPDDYISICYSESREGEIERSRFHMDPEERSYVSERERYCRIQGDHVCGNSGWIRPRLNHKPLERDAL